jgi:hypothetical protein
MSAVAEPLPPVDSWDPLQLRLIVFPLHPHTAIQQDWWQQVTGIAEFDSSRKLAERVDSGIVDGRGLSLMIDPMRIMWSLDPRLDADQVIAAPPTLGALTQANEWFSPLMHRWLNEMCPEVKRLACFFRLFQTTPTREDSYRLLSRYLPNVNLDPTATDFMFRINRKRPSVMASNLEINRLCQWAGARLAIGAHARTPSNPLATQDFEFAAVFGCSVDIDVNTSAEFTDSIPRDQLGGLFDELQDTAVEIAAMGDIP